MKKSAMVRARIEPDVKQHAEEIFQNLGMTVTQAITIFYKQVEMRNGLPFNVSIPNEETIKTFKATDSGQDLVVCKDAEDMFTSLGIWFIAQFIQINLLKIQKKSQRRGKNIGKFKIIAKILLSGQPLNEIHKDHKLIGNYVGRRECHIEPDWLLIYKVTESQIIFERIGTHSDLFKK